jgi:hypothetical protein
MQRTLIAWIIVICSACAPEQGISSASPGSISGLGELADGSGMLGFHIAPDTALPAELAEFISELRCSREARSHGNGRHLVLVDNPGVINIISRFQESSGSIRYTQTALSRRSCRLLHHLPRDPRSLELYYPCWTRQVPWDSISPLPLEATLPRQECG